MDSTHDLDAQTCAKVDGIEDDFGFSLDEGDKEVASAESDSLAVELTETNMGMDLEVNSSTSDHNEIEETATEPFVGMMFQSGVASYRFYNEYAKLVGFGVRKKLCRRSKSNNEVIGGWYVCSREGMSVANEKTENPRNARRIGCPAAMKVKRMANKEWKVILFTKEHNHELDPENVSSFRSHKKNRVLKKNRINGGRMRPRDKIVMSHEQSSGQEGECRTKMEREPRKFFTPADAHAIHMLFMSMHSKNPAFFYAVEFDEEQHLKSVFWADAKSKVACTHFGDVVAFDTTDLEDNYKVPFAPFVGVNHHGQCILLGCALLADESTSSFVWLFRTWLDVMSRKPPKAIITDQNEDIAAAITQVFPETRHRFCLWHILQRVPKKLADVCGAHENFMKKFHKCIYESMTDDEFEKRWWKLIHRFGLMNEEWLQNLYKERRKWVPLYLKDTFFAGMSTSQQGEIMNSMFEKYISRDTSLKEFLEKYELAIESKYEDEAQEDFWSLHSKPKERMHPSPFELQLVNVYTKTMFERFQAEVLGISSVFASKIEEDGDISTYKVKAYEVQEDKRSKKVKEKEYKVVWNALKRKVYCVCCLFEFKGYLCRHALAVFLALGVLEIPSHYILKRWTKDAKSRHVLDEGYTLHGDCSESVAQRFNDVCLRSFKFAEEASLSKRSYEVALHALQEAFGKVINANKNVEKNSQYNYSHSGGYYMVSEGSRSNNMETMSVVCDPQVSNTVEVPNKRIKSRGEKGASKLNKDMCGKLGISINTSTEIGHNLVHMPSGEPILIDECGIQDIVQPME